MAEEVIGLLFGVEGLGVNGASGKEIVKGLTKIVNEINSGKSTVPKIKLKFDTTEASKAVDNLKAKLKDIEKIASIKIAQSHGGKSIGASGNAAEDLQKQVKKYTELSAAIKKWIQDSKIAAKLSAEYASLSRNMDGSMSGDGVAEGYDKTIRSINATVEALKELKFTFAEVDDEGLGIKRGDILPIEIDEIKQLATEIGITEDQYRELYEQMQAGAIKAQQAEQNANRSSQNSWDKYVRNVSQQIDQMYDTISKNPAVKKMADDLRKYMQSGSGDVGDLKNRFDELTRAASESGANIETWGDKFKKTFAGKVRSALAGAITVSFTKYLRDVYQNVVDLDKSLVNLQIATGGTREETKRLIKDYADLAKQMSATTAEVAASADTWLRQGYSAQESETLIRNSMMLSKLGQMESSEASTALTSAMKGYNVSVEDSIEIVDKFTKVDMAAAASAGDIATAMAETATSAKIAGVSMDKLIGYITTVKEVTQDGAESVGTFYKTLFARMNNVKAGKFVDDETGESLNDVEKVLGKLGIDLRDTNGLFRDSGDVLDEVGRKWKSFDNVQQHAIATAFAGTKQQEKFIVLMENYKTAMEYATVATESAGTATKKYEAYTESIEGKINSLKTTFAELSMTILNSEWVTTGVEVLTETLELLTKIAGAGDGVVIAVVAISSAILLLNAAFDKTQTKIKNLIIKYAELGGVSVEGAITTEAFKEALLQFSSAGLLGAITTIPRFIIAIGKYIVSAKAGAGATLTFKEALEKMKVNPWLLAFEGIIVAIATAVSYLKKYSSESARASAEAKEHAQAMREVADKAKDEQDSLDDLIDGYEEITSRGIVSADSREEILNIQKQINLLVKDEASKWDMVNGSIDDTIEKLRQVRAQTASANIQTYKDAYLTARSSANQAYEVDRSDLGNWEFLSGVAGVDELIVEGYDEDAARILNKLPGVSANRDYTLDWFWTTDYTNINFAADNAVEYYNRISEAMHALENDSSYEHLESTIYYRLSKLKQAYETYVTTVTESVDMLLDGIVTYIASDKEAQKGFAIETIDDYQSFVQDIIDDAEQSDHLKEALKAQDITVESITNAVNDYMALNYPGLYDELADKTDKINNRLKSFLDILNEVQGSFDILSQSLDDMDKYGVLSADTISKLLDPENGYPALEKYLTLTANGYTISADALEKFIEEQKYSYVTALATATKGTEAYNIAYQNLERFLAAITTLQLSKEIEKETEALENERDALDGQRDKYKELIEIRKDLLKTYADELKYQKELEKKQRNIARLNAKLSVAKLDTSAAGQARVRELEAELKEAQDEFDDFTLDHAIDALTSKIDNQYKEYEHFVEAKVSEITTAINRVASAIRENTPSASEQITLLMERLNSAPAPGSPLITRSQFDANHPAGQRFRTYEDYLKYNHAKGIYHQGGLVGDIATLSTSEEFAKLLKGEFVSTPTQMKRFMEETLPKIANYSAAGSVNEFNAPLVEIVCESVTTESLPELERVVNEAVRVIQKQLDSGMSRTGFKRPMTKRLT